MIVRFVLLQKDEGRHDAATVPKANHPRRSDAPLYVAPQVHYVPANNDSTDAEGPHGREADCPVFGRKMRGAVDGHQDGKTDNEQRETEEDEWRTNSPLIGEVRYDYDEAKRGCKRWY